MAAAFMGGLIASGKIKSTQITANDINKERLKEVKDLYYINIDDTIDAIENADIIIFAVKPDQIEEVATEIDGHIKDDCLLISIAAGITTTFIEKCLNNDKAKIVRVMPNTPAFVQEAMSVLYPNINVTEDDKETALELLNCIGKTIVTDDEDKLDVVTGLSGSGPGYLFLIMDAMKNAGTDLGLSEDDAKLLTMQTFLGTAKLALTSDEDFDTLRQNVTSPGGTTAAGLKVLNEKKVAEAFKEAIKKAAERSKELSK